MVADSVSPVMSPESVWRELSTPARERLLAADLDKPLPVELSPHLEAAGLPSLLGVKQLTELGSGASTYQASLEFGAFVQTKKEEAGL